MLNSWEILQHEPSERFSLEQIVASTWDRTNSALRTGLCLRLKPCRLVSEVSAEVVQFLANILLPYSCLG